MRPVGSEWVWLDVSAREPVAEARQQIARLRLANACRSRNRSLHEGLAVHCIYGTARRLPQVVQRRHPASARCLMASSVACRLSVIFFLIRFFTIGPIRGTLYS